MQRRALASTATSRLLVVATPLGNAEDMSPRACHVLREATVVLAEDTRVAHALLRGPVGLPDGHGPRVLRCDEHASTTVAGRIAEQLRNTPGATAALISDAGTPAISDPGARVVAACHAAGGVVVSPVPGPSAVAAAISVSGHSGAFVFDGFVPRAGEARAQWLASLRTEPRAVVCFESPRRLAALLQDVVDTGTSRWVTLCRELTKPHEEVIRFTSVAAARVWATARDASDSGMRGEVTLVFGPRPSDLDASHRH